MNQEWKPKFLERVKVRQFVESVKRYGQNHKGEKCHIRKPYFTPNKSPDIVYVVIGTTFINEGYSEYLDYDNGYGFKMTTRHKVYIVANTLGRRFKVRAEDILPVE